MCLGINTFISKQVPLISVQLTCNTTTRMCFMLLCVFTGQNHNKGLDYLQYNVLSYTYLLMVEPSTHSRLKCQFVGCLLRSHLDEQFTKQASSILKLCQKQLREPAVMCFFFKAFFLGGGDPQWSKNPDL